MSTFEKHRNTNGTYNGVSLFAELTGLPESEIAWMAARIKELHGKGFSVEDAKKIVRAEARRKPWEVK